METRTFIITANKDMMLKIERFLAWLHFNTAWGHSGTVAIDCDGDGQDDVNVDVQHDDAGIYRHRGYVKSVKEKNKSVEWISCEVEDASES